MYLLSFKHDFMRTAHEYFTLKSQLALEYIVSNPYYVYLYIYYKFVEYKSIFTLTKLYVILIFLNNKKPRFYEEYKYWKSDRYFGHTYVHTPYGSVLLI